MDGSKPLMGSTCQDAINLMASCEVLVGEPHSFSHYLARFLYNARIWDLMARTRRDLGYSRSLV
jgi:hypothetical protein